MIFLKLLSIGMSIILILIAFININPYKLSCKEYVMMILSIASSYMIIFSLSSNLATIPLYLIPILFIYKKNHKITESIIFGIFITVVVILVDNFTGSIVIRVISPEFLESTLGNYITCAMIALILYPVSKFIGKLLIKYKLFIDENYKSKYAILLYMILILTFVLFYVNINWNKSSTPVYLTEINGIAFITYGIIMIIVFISILFMLKKEETFNHKQIQLDNLKEYTENLEKLYMDMRKFRHDYVNIISTIAGFIEERDMEALEEHFNKNIYPLNNKMNKNNYKLGLLKNIELPEIKGLLSGKIVRAQELGIDTNIDIVEPITKINMDIIDLSRCLGIIFDNAIEASLESEKKVVNVALINKNTSVIIVVINTFKGDLPSLSKLFKEGFSTKGENRGLGLSNLKDIMSRYKNISLDTYIKEDEFVQEITIGNK
ncbi:MAG: GHKL domain-containing protein [Clostridium butyricum]|nr:GHKL domain-containing protein [Clostridium butyricum]